MTPVIPVLLALTLALAVAGGGPARAQEMGGLRAGAAAAELEADDSMVTAGGIACFLEGASGSTHNLSLTGDESARRIKQAVQDALAQAKPRPVERLAAIKRPFTFKVRRFNEAKEDEAVSTYCRKYAGPRADATIQVFRDMRKKLAPMQGQTRKTWLQAVLIGDVAITDRGRSRDHAPATERGQEATQ